VNSLHTIQFSILLPVGQRVLSVSMLSFLTVIAFLIPVLMIYSRMCVVMNQKPFDKTATYSTPEDETDDVPTKSTYALTIAVFLEGMLLALFSAVTAGYTDNLSSSGLFSQSTLNLTLRFSSITLQCFHRVLLPANRADPVRTILEVLMKNNNPICYNNVLL